jgi:hypothetical protein
LILTDAFHRGGGDHKIPRRSEDLGVSQCLPELDVKVPVRVLAPDQPLHNEAFFHCSYYLPRNALTANCLFATPSGWFLQLFYTLTII